MPRRVADTSSDLSGSVRKRPSTCCNLVTSPGGDPWWEQQLGQPMRQPQYPLTGTVLADQPWKTQAKQNFYLPPPPLPPPIARHQTHPASVLNRCPIGTGAIVDQQLQMQQMQLTETLESIKQNNAVFQENILKAVGELSSAVEKLKTAIEELPAKIVSAIGSLPTSRTVSIVSESEIEESLNYLKELNIGDQPDDELLAVTGEQCCDKEDVRQIWKESKCDGEPTKPTVKFVFEYNPIIDMDKWLKKSDK